MSEPTKTEPTAQAVNINQSDVDLLYKKLINLHFELQHTAEQMEKVLYSKCSFRHLSMRYQGLIRGFNYLLSQELAPIVGYLSQHSDNNPLAGFYQPSEPKPLSDDD